MISAIIGGVVGLFVPILVAPALLSDRAYVMFALI